jgi:lipid II:glycine glycyltransferase (peptidoglycan interpeptide bridge formation enzyme)
MKLIEVRESEKQQYNDFVATQKGGSFLQGWAWGEWQTRLGRTVYRYWILEERGVRLASIQLIKMPLPLGKCYWYAPYGPVLAKSENFQFSIFKLLQQALKERFLDAVFVRIEPKFPLPTTHYPLLTKSTNIQPSKTFIIDLSKTEDELLAEMQPKTRYNIRLAQKHGVEVKDEFEISVGNGLFAKEAVSLIVETSQRQGYKGYGKEYYEDLINFLGLNNQAGLKLHIYKAIYKNQLLASAIMLDFAGTRTFLFGGSSDEHKNVMAPYLMHYRAMLDAKNLGLNFYDFWGIETSKGETPGFVRFKLGFGKPERVVEYSGAYDVIFSKYWYKIYTIFRKSKRIFGI